MSVDERRVRGEQIRQVFGMEPIGLAATVANAGATCAVLWSHVPHLRLLVWFGYLAVVTVVRLFLLWRYHATPGLDTRKLLRSCVVGVAMSGLGWGMLGGVLFPVESLSHQVFIAFVLGGMTAGAAVVYSPVRRAFSAYTIPSLLPLIIRLASTGNRMHLAMAGMVLLFAVLMYATFRMLHRATRRTLVLRFENEALVEHLKEETARLDDANEQLRAEVERRRTAEEKLQGTLNELQRSNAELERFAYVASHDLQAPLRKVQSFATLFARRHRDAVGADGQRYIDGLVNATTHMRSLIEDLLKYSRVGREQLKLAPANLGNVVRNAMAALEVTLEESGTEVTMDEMPTVPVHERLLSTVFQNLFANAIMFRRDDPPRVHVGAERCGNEWVVSVRDNGIGMAEKQFERIFQIFQRLHGPTEYPGTGIGLAICKKVVERHGGRIWAESEPDKGSTFSFHCPRGRKNSREFCGGV